MASQATPQPNFEPDDVFVVDDLDTLKVLADPLRLRILEIMHDPSTVKQVANELELPPTKLYYHINLLEKHNLIVLVDTRIVSGIIEKHYQVAAWMVRVEKNLLSPSDETLSLTMNALFDTSRDQLLDAVRAGAVELDEEGEKHKGVILRSSSLRLTQEQAAAFYDELETLVKRYSDLSDGQRKQEHLTPYHAFYAAFPMRRPSTADDDT